MNPFTDVGTDVEYHPRTGQRLAKESLFAIRLHVAVVFAVVSVYIPPARSKNKLAIRGQKREKRSGDFLSHVAVLQKLLNGHPF